MSNKSKVTSIRVDSEIYDKFKDIVAEEGKQVSAAMNKMMQKHIEQHETILYCSQQEHNRIKAGFEKIKDQIDWTKVSRYTFSSVSSYVGVGQNLPNFIDSVIKREIQRTEMQNPIAYILETDGGFNKIDLLIIEPKTQE